MEENSHGVLWKKRFIQNFVLKALLQTTLQTLELPTPKPLGIYENYFPLHLARGLDGVIFSRPV